jgi:cell division protein FtsW
MEKERKEFNINFSGDWFLLACTIVLIGFGILIVYSAASARAVSTGLSTERIFAGHLMMLFLGFITMIITAKINYKWFGLLSVPMMLLSIMLLALVSFTNVGVTINDASRWISVPIIGVTFQPSDLAKISIVIYMAFSLSKLQDSIDNFKDVLLKSVIMPMIVIILIALNNISTAILLTMIVGIIMFIGRVHSKVFLSFFGVILMALPVVYFASSRVKTAVSRMMDYFSTGVDGIGVSDLPHQVEQANIAMALGGFNGVGLGHSQQKFFLPMAFSDYIYAIIIEEHGFKIGLVILFLFLAIFYRGMKITQKTTNPFSGLLVIGLSLLVVLQALIHMAVVTGLFPVTGLTLPWISTGGTSLLFTGLAFGIILNVSKETNAIDSK